ncbi:c-type cytochrome [Bradyrhizobium sp. CCBAU 51627]|uniref:c-type cytochrome n=1 Tax=Bradyrhizobium sp. CCBAU 51627 TaxID=1325088 RepID=UPI002305137E|nr:cytochrome c [Bradyrhizobium sp. CCBAU 51627]
MPSFALTQDEVIFCITLVLIGAFSLFLPKFLTAGNVLTPLNNVATLGIAQSVATDREPTGPAMPAFGWQLNDEQVAAVATYIRNHWGKAPPVSKDDVRKERTSLDTRIN